jgi:hypothetical protein
MLNNKLKNTLIILIVLIVFSGCSGGGYERLHDPYQGNEGLMINFIQNAPPDIIYEQEKFPFGFILKNKGAYDIQRGIVTISYEKDYIKEYITDDNSIILNGRSIFNPNGEEKNRLFYFETSKMDSMSQIRNSIMAVTACYEYNNKLKTEVCIDSDVFNLIGDRSKPCTVKSESFSGQGAPVGITYLVPTMSKTPDNDEVVIPEFEITISNLNFGNVIKKESIYRYCSNEAITRDEMGIVEIEARLGNQLLECNPRIINLNNENTGKTKCKLNHGIYGVTTSYNSLLEVDLKYGYTTATSKEFKIYRR